MSSSHNKSLFPKTAIQRILGRAPILIHPDLAIVIGTNNAICWQQINYWINNDAVEHIFGGRRWVYNTYAQWQKQLPFLAKRTIKKAFQDLEKMGLILSHIFEGNIKYYSIDYEAVSCLLEGGLVEESAKKIETVEEDFPLEHDETPSDIKCTPSDIKCTPSDIKCTPSDIKCTPLGHKMYPPRTFYVPPYIDTKTTQRLHKEREANICSPTPPMEAPLKEDSKSIKKNGCSLNVNWVLPDEWRQWSIQCGMMNEEIDMSEHKFRNHWLSTTKNAVKKDWFRTWQNWCINEYEKKGLRLKVRNSSLSIGEGKGSKTPVKLPTKISQSTDPKIQKWYELQPLLKERIGESTYESWIENNLELISVGEKAVFTSRSNFTKDWICNNFRSDIAAILAHVDPKLGLESNIEFTSPSTNKTPHGSP